MHPDVRSRAPRRPRRAARRSAAVLAAVGTLLAACSEHATDEPGTRATKVYAAIVRWFTDARSDDPEPLPVFVEARGEGSSIPLEVQAELITEVEDVADVRFIDSRDEAMDVADDGDATVVDGGILVRLSPVDEISDPVLVDVDVHLQGETFLTMRFELDQLDDDWVLAGDPEQLSVPSGGSDPDGS